MMNNATKHFEITNSRKRFITTKMNFVTDLATFKNYENLSPLYTYPYWDWPASLLFIFSRK